jgi:hypothetical protein
VARRSVEGTVEPNQNINPLPRTDRTMTTAVDVKHHLQLLHTERALALSTPLRHDTAYMADLDEEIVATHHAWISSAVLELARLREDLGSARQG